jgi:4-hydroxythreonine-4-phosphate dehydrogenase
VTELPAIAVTVGDPSGIGPEIAMKATRNARVTAVCRPILYGPHQSSDVSHFPAGEVSVASARAAYDAIVTATRDVLAGRVSALATAPIHKAAFAAAGYPWLGHTDLLAELCGAREVAMMFWSDRLRVVLATVHIPLSRVPSVLTIERLAGIVRLAATALPDFGFPSPRLALAGLNPHAGEEGLLGREEIDVLQPVIADARERGIDLSGPFPADTVFVRAARGEFDAVVACYHDQGLIPVKLLAFGHAVNVTLGLPIVRTSVDHGTAFDIARKGVADDGSLVEAILLAAKLSVVRADRRGALPAPPDAR